MTPDDIEAAAQALFAADHLGQQIGLLSLRYPGMTLDDAYTVQSRLLELKLAAGRHKIGWKIGLTSRAMQDALKIETPDSGMLLDDMMFTTGSSVPKGRYIQPRVEAEIAFVMASPVSGNATRTDVLDATAYVTPALEILDTRIVRQDPDTGQPRLVTDTISDNAANAGIVLGSEQHDPRAVDLRWVGAIVSRDGVIEETGLGAGVLNDPVVAVQWLAQRLSGYEQQIDTGDIILSGSFIRPVECPSGSQILGDFGVLGRVQIAFD